MNRFHSLKKSQRGFTLIELMIAIVVLAILIAVAVPSFTQQIQRSQMRGAMADFITAVAYARSQAVSRSTTIHVLSTLNSNDWSGGWCVSTSASACGTSTGAATDTLLRDFEGPGSITATGQGTTKSFSFNQQGYVENHVAASKISLCGSGDKGKTIEILPLGQALAQDCVCTNNVCN